MQTIYLDISNKGVMPTLYAKQGDVGRKFMCIISDSGLPYEIPADATVSVLYQNLKDTNAGSASEVDVIGNSVEVTLASAITSVSGDGILCLTISYKNGDEISTWNIPYSVDPKPGVQPINPESPIWQQKAVLYTKQNLTESQKEQARKNIDAVKTPTKITKELFFFGEHDDFQAFGNQRIYKIAGQQVWLNSPTDFDFRVQFNIVRNVGQVEKYEFTKADCKIIETVQGRKHWQFFADVSGTPSLVLTVANGIDPGSFESDPYCSFIYPSDLENYSVEFFKLSETEQELNLVTSVNGIQADEYGNVTIETGGGSTQEEVYVLSLGETVENAPKDVKIVIDPNEEAPAYVQTVNGIAPDKNGNVVVSGGGSGGGAQSDWNAKEGEPGHVLNRTHWVENANVIILEDTTLVADENNPGLFFTEADITLEVGKTYTVFYNGTEYACVAVDGATITEEYTGMAIIGNFAAVMGTGNTGEPFAAAIAPGYAIQIMDLQSATACTIAIHYSGELVHKLDGKYLPDSVPYIKVSYEEVIPLAAFEVDESGISSTIDEFPSLEIGATYIVTYNGIEYERVAYDYSDSGATLLGSSSVYDNAGSGVLEEGDDPWVVVDWRDGTGEIDYYMPSTSFEIGVKKEVENIHKLDEKYIPDTIARVSDIFGAMEASY